MNDYPNLWRRGLIQKRVRERAGHRCEHCGMKFLPGTNLAATDLRRNGKPVIGTVHHLDGNKANCSMSNLIYVCQICHLSIQASWKPGDVLPLRWGRTAPRWLTSRGLPYLPHPQISMFESDLDHAHA